MKKKNIDGESYLMYKGGYVLDENEEPIIVLHEENEDNQIDSEDIQKVGVF